MIKDQFSGTTNEFRTAPEGLAELLVLYGDTLDMEDKILIHHLISTQS